MVVRPSTVSEKWESKGSWVLSSSCCRSLKEDHKSRLIRRRSGTEEALEKRKAGTEEALGKRKKLRIWKPYLSQMKTWNN